jgi:hypothetical protein
MSQLIAERDAEVQAMAEEQSRAAGPFLLGDYPHLDADQLFQLQHPFPPTHRSATRLADQYASNGIT